MSSRSSRLNKPLDRSVNGIPKTPEKFSKSPPTVSSKPLYAGFSIVVVGVSEVVGTEGEDKKETEKCMIKLWAVADSEKQCKALLKKRIAEENNPAYNTPYCILILDISNPMPKIREEIHHLLKLSTDPGFDNENIDIISNIILSGISDLMINILKGGL